jgi:hypothetical protein
MVRFLFAVLTELPVRVFPGRDAAVKLVTVALAE